MALAQYREKFWFPSGTLAADIPARVFLENDNVFAPLFTDATGTTPKPNPTRTDAQGFLDFWAEEGLYWLHIDTESFRITVGATETPATEGYVLARIADHNADTTDVHGIPDTSLLATQADLTGLATDAQVTAVADDLAAHEAATTTVHGIANTAALETTAGAQAKADAAENNAIATAATDATQKANQAETNAEQTAAAALDAHAADTTSVHGIADTSVLVTQADLSGYATSGDLATVANDLAAHEAATTNVHGIADTSVLETQAGAQAKADTAKTEAVNEANFWLNAHEADTTNVHGIADTATLETQAGAQAKADAAQAAAEATAAATYLPLTGGTVTGPLQVDDDLTVLGSLAVTGDSVGMARGVYKEADESYTNDTTLHADAELALPVTAGAVYLLTMFIHASGDTAGDINMDFTFPTGSAFIWTESGVSNGNSNNIGSIKYNPNTGSTASSVGLLTTGTAFTPSGTLRVGGTAGTLVFRWAQLTASGTPTVVRAGSVMTLLRIA